MSDRNVSLSSVQLKLYYLFTHAFIYFFLSLKQSHSDMTWKENKNSLKQLQVHKYLRCFLTVKELYARFQAMIVSNG